MIAIVIDAFGTVPKGLVRRSWKSEDGPRLSKLQHFKTGQNTEKTPGDKETCYRSDSNERPSANAGVKKLALTNNNIFLIVAQNNAINNQLNYCLNKKN